MYYETHDEMTIAETLVALRQQRRYLVEMQEQFNFIKEFSQSAEAQRMINDLKNSLGQSAAASCDFNFAGGILHFDRNLIAMSKIIAKRKKFW